MEPNTASYEERVRALYDLHALGCKTWASVEPYPTPNIQKQEILPILDSLKMKSLLYLYTSRILS